MTASRLPAPAALVARAAILGPLVRSPGRALLSILGIAAGIALAVAVHVIHASAIDEFTAAVQSLSGEADFVLRGPRAGFAEDLYPRVAGLPGIETAAPVVEVDVKVEGRQESLKLLGLDPFQAWRIQPALAAGMATRTLDLLAPDAVLLSPAAARWLDAGEGDSIRVQVGLKSVPLRVIGLLPEEAYRQRLAVADIATAQWALERLGTLSRIDVRLRAGHDPAAVQAALSAAAPPGVEVTKPEAESERGASLSRPYRVNLSVLALVALFTGMFLVFTTQALSVLRRRGQFALLRVLGLTRRGLLAFLLAEASTVGLLGSALGVALGALAGSAILAHLGGDLGAGYFHAVTVRAALSPVALAGFLALGTGAALLGALAPALEAARTEPALALKAGDRERAFEGLRRPWAGLGLLGLGAALTQAPPVAGLPLFGYGAIALLLTGTIALMPAFAALALQRLPSPRSVPLRLALEQLRGAPGQVAVSLAAILAAFSLMVAMVIMVASFRDSVDTWLQRVLQADLFLRSASAGQSAYLSPEDQARIRAVPGVRDADFIRYQSLLLAPDRPPVLLMGRALDPARPYTFPPVIGPVREPAPGDPPAAWVSEAMAEVYGMRPGARIELPIAGRPQPFIVAGVWRDYARQTGAIIVESSLYQRLSGDTLANDAAVWVEPGDDPDAVASRIREQVPGGAALEIAPRAAIRALSLAIFDRTFAVTYGLEIAAVLIGLLGVATSFGAQVLARRGEFAMLRHVGMTRREVTAMLAAEGALAGVLGVVAGLALGLLISLILIHVVNRQSFHWSMDMAIPWLPLALLAAALVAAATAAAAWAARRALSGDVLRAVREDW